MTIFSQTWSLPKILNHKKTNNMKKFLPINLTSFHNKIKSQSILMNKSNLILITLTIKFIRISI
jgi:hypothetical protein